MLVQEARMVTVVAVGDVERLGSERSLKRTPRLACFRQPPDFVPNALELAVPTEGAREIASRSRGTPRIANRLLRRARDYAEVKADGIINAEISRAALDMLKVDQSGLDHMDRRLILSLIEKFDGGPVGVESLAAAIGEERGTIEDVIEPYLIQQGFMMRTPRGRVVTSRAYSHFGLKPLSQGEIDL